MNDLIPAVETHYSTYLESPDEAGILASRQHRAIGGFSLGSINTWYVFEQAFPYSKWYLPMSGDNWSQGMYGGQYYPDATAQFLADLVNKSPYRDDFYVWYACGSEDVRLPQSQNQALAMAKLSDTFNAKNFSYHMKEGGRHDFNAVWEFCYHALQFFFPAKSSEPVSTYYNRQSRISDVMADPDFGDYGRLIFPVNTGYWDGTTLEDLDLTWYNYIDPDKTVEVVNYFKAHHQDVLIDIYTEAEKAASPDKRNTGLFFFRGREGAPCRAVWSRSPPSASPPSSIPTTACPTASASALAPSPKAGRPMPSASGRASRQRPPSAPPMPWSQRPRTSIRSTAPAATQCSEASTSWTDGKSLDKEGFKIIKSVSKHHLACLPIFHIAKRPSSPTWRIWARRSAGVQFRCRRTKRWRLRAVPRPLRRATSERGRAVKRSRTSMRRRR